MAISKPIVAVFLLIGALTFLSSVTNAGGIYRSSYKKSHGSSSSGSDSSSNSDSSGGGYKHKKSKCKGSSSSGGCGGSGSSSSEEGGSYKGHKKPYVPYKPTYYKPAPYHYSGGYWSSWSHWTSCYGKCNGFTHRYRKCLYGYCSGHNTETHYCKYRPECYHKSSYKPKDHY